MISSPTFKWKFFKAKTSKSCFQFFFFKQSSDFLLANSSALSYTCTIPTAGTENCVQVSVCWGCVKIQKKPPCKEEIRFLGWAGDFYLFLEQQSNCCASMDVFFFVSVPVNFFFVWLQWEANQKSWTNVHEILQHLNFSFLTKTAKHRAHGLRDTDLETLSIKVLHVR